jgi:hypothetical protein
MSGRNPACTAITVADFRPDIVFFPDPAEIAPHAIAFARMMFAHTSLERRVAALQDAITRQPGFGEQRANQWGTRQRPKLMVELIETERGKGFPQTDELARLLTDASTLASNATCSRTVNGGVLIVRLRQSSCAAARAGSIPKSRHSIAGTRQPTLKRWGQSSRTSRSNFPN